MLFERAWSVVKGDGEPIPGFGATNDSEKIDQIQRILDDIARERSEGEEKARESAGPGDCVQCGDSLDGHSEWGDTCDHCHYEGVMDTVEEYDMEDYEGDDIWGDRWKIPPPSGGWRMFSHGGSRDTNLPHLLQSGVDPKHLKVVNIGPQEHTPWGYLSGEDTVWMSKESPYFDRLMSRYVEDEPEDYDPWERMT